MLRQKVHSHILMAINKQNNRHKTAPKTHIAFIMPRSKGIGRCHKSGTGNYRCRQQGNDHDNRCSNFKDSHVKSNEFSSPGISVFPPLNNSVMDPPHVSSVGQQSSSSSKNSTRRMAIRFIVASSSTSRIPSTEIKKGEK